ncbi:hypothetical protein ACIBG7_15285 [Nonomuraea sp. NPDC050328]|uniref:hypothetical protein n=1 Tax=Nonomuraea sp. NPDC050328 TaxID=3364361 RepID=UPI00379F7542
MGMPMDPFAGTAVHDPVRMLQELSTRMSRVEQLLGQRPGVPVTKTSGPLFLPNGVPSTPSGGIYLFASGGDFWWRSSDGSEYSGIPPEVPSAGAVFDPVGYNVSNAPGSYSSSHSQALVDGLFSVGNRLVATLDALKSAGLMDFA